MTPSPDPLAALREAERIVLWICEACGLIHAYGSHGMCERCGSEEPAPRTRRVEVIPLQATEPLVAENEELRRERDAQKKRVDNLIALAGAEKKARWDVEGVRPKQTERGLRAEIDGHVQDKVVWRQRAEAAEADAESARSTSEALAGALEEIAQITDGAGWLNHVDIGTEEIAEKIKGLGDIARSALDSARTPTEENPNG